MSDAVVQPTYAFEGFQLDAQHRVLARANGEPIALAPKVFDTLLYLVERPGRLIAKRELLEAIWPHVVVEENNLNQAISGLRRVLGEITGEHRFIVTAPGHGYRFVAEVRIASAAHEATPQPPAVVTAAAEVAAVGGPRIAKPRSGQRLVATLIAALALTAGGVWLIQREGALPATGTQLSAAQSAASRALLPSSVAVLPLQSVGTGPEQAAFATGLHVDIISRLSRVRTLTVIAREAVLEVAATSNSFAEIATTLRVQSLLSASVQHSDGRIRVNVELVDPLTNRNLWAQDYDRDFQDILAVQADIATNVAAALNAQLTAADRRRMDLRPTTSAAAYAEYLLALDSQTSGKRAEALAQFERAVGIDPAFAEAHGQLALLYARSVIDWANDPAVSMDPKEMERRATLHANRALALDQNLAVAHTALGELHTYFWRWTEAESEFVASYRLDPNDLDMLVFYSHFRTFRGDYDEALRLADQLLVINPPTKNTNSFYNRWIAQVYAGNVDQAVATLNEQLVLYPASITALINLGYIEARRADVQAAKDAFDVVEGLTRGRRSANMSAGLAYGYARIGRAEKAEELFREVQSSTAAGTVGDGTQALAYLAIGAEDQALEWLERAVQKIAAHQPDAGWFNLMMLKHNVAGDPVLEGPRFKELRGRIRGS